MTPSDGSRTAEVVEAEVAGEPFESTLMSLRAPLLSIVLDGRNRSQC
jgi:hypothetical protein